MHISPDQPENREQLKTLKVLVVDDEPNIRKTVKYSLSELGMNVFTAGDALEALEFIQSYAIHIVFLDLRLGNSDGMDLINPILAHAPWVKIVIITAHGSVESAVRAIKSGAFDYIMKPFGADVIRTTAARVGFVYLLESQNRQLSEELAQSGSPILLESANPEYRRILEDVKTAAASEAIILLLGESGTGKTSIARAIHQWSGRSAARFSTVSCPAIPEALLESELFGHRKGAFTGATQDQAGKVEHCEGGSLLLDEIGEMPLSVQPKILRFIQERQYERVGDPVSRHANVRIIAATNQDLKEQVAEGNFREDLFYRLEVISITIPPLREHYEDIPQLVNAYLKYFSTSYNKIGFSFSAEANSLLQSYTWPGNIRELRNLVERLVIMNTPGKISAAALPEKVTGNKDIALLSSKGYGTLKDLERNHIRNVLNASDTLLQAAEILGVDKSTLWRKRKEFGL